MRSRFISYAWMTKVVMVMVFLQCLKMCDYEPSGTWFNDIEVPEAEIPTAKLNYEDSLIIIDEPTHLEFSLQFSKQRLYEVVFLLNDFRIGRFPTSQGSILIDVQDGEHILEMVVYTSSNSGSIADKLGNEVFMYSKRWKILCESKDESHIQITSIKPADESLRIQWNLYEGNMFQSYTLYKKSTKGDILLFESTDPDRTTYDDPYYLGGEVKYYLTFSKINGDEFISEVKSFYTDSGAIQLDYDMATQELCIVWPRCQFDRNFRSYQVYQRTNDDQPILIYSSETIGDTTHNILIEDEQSMQFDVVYQSKMPDSTPGNGEFLISSATLEAGTFPVPSPFPRFQVIASSKRLPYRIYTPNFYYDVSQEGFTNRNYANPRGLFDVSFGNVQHLSGSSLYRGDGSGSYFGFHKSLTQIPSSFFNSSERRADLSDSRFLILESGSSVYLYDIDTNAVSQHFEDDSLYWAAISPEGRYIIAADTNSHELDIYHIIQEDQGGFGAWQLQWKNSLEGIAGNYIFKDEEEFVMIKEGLIQIRTARDSRPANADGIRRSGGTPATRLVEIDPISSTILACSEDRLFVHDLTDLQLLGEVPNTGVYPKVNKRGPGEVAYLNGTVFYHEEGNTEATMLPLPLNLWR